MNPHTEHTSYHFIYTVLSNRVRLTFLILLSLFLCTNSFAQTTWTGATSSDWFDASNWSDDIPDANDDVTIDPSSNDPTIATTTAFANSILINDNATLTIAASGTLEVNLVSEAVTNRAVRVHGTMSNSGTIIIGSTSSGLRGIEIGQTVPVLSGTFNNNDGALLQIDNFTNTGIYIVNTAGNSFVNDGNIDIGLTNGSSNGITGEQGTFENSTNGVITMDNLTGNCMWLFNQFIFNNSGSINIGLDFSAAGSFGIENRGTFNNLTGSVIDIFGFSNRGIYNFSSGTMEFPAEFNNAGSISLDGNMSAGAYGVVVAGEFSTFNNQTGGSIEVTDVSTLGVSTGFGGANDFGSVFNNSGNITTQGINNTTNQGVGVWDGTFNHNAGTILVNNASIPISLFSGSSTFNNSASIITQNLPFATSNIVNGPDDSFTNNVGGSINGFGQIQSNSFVDNGGTIIPGEPYGIIRFNGDVDLSLAVINLDINGGDTAGTDYDKIENNTFSDHTITLGGTLNLNITYTPSVDLKYIKIIEAGSEVIGEFATVNGLPDTEWELLYNFPTLGDVSLEYGAINSVQSGAFSDPNTWADGIVPNINNPAIVEDGHTVTIDAGQTFEVARLQTDGTATVIVPQTSVIEVNNSMGTSVINHGNLDIDGTLTINGSQSKAIENDGIINLDGTVGTSGIIDIINTTTTAIDNKGDLIIGDNATVNIEDANIAIENSDEIIINEDGLLEIDFTIETAIITNPGSSITNNGQTLIGMDVTATNSLGQYGIDHSGYLLNSATGLIEISEALESQILLPFVDNTLQRTNPLDGSIDNFGEMNLNGSADSAIEQSDSPSTVRGKYKHKVRKRPTLNPDRNTGRNTGGSSFTNQMLSILRGNGIIESDITFLDGGTISPGLIDGDEGIIVFDGDEDFQNITFEIDVNGKTLKGTDYDLIALVGITTLGDDLDIEITYTPEIGDIITFIESDNVVGTFNNPTLPANWAIKYNFPNQGDVSVEYGELLSIDENGLESIEIYSQLEQDNILISGNIISETKFELFDVTGRLVLTKELDIMNTSNAIEVSHLASGSYIVKLSSKSDNIKTKKIIID